MPTLRLPAGNPPVPVADVTDEITADIQALTGRGALYGVMVKTDGSNDVTLALYDGTSTAGKKLIPEDIVIPGDSNFYPIGFTPALIFHDGVYVAISGTGAVAILIYDQGN